MSKQNKARPKVQVAFRLPAETVERLNSAVDLWTAATGVETTRTAIATAALKRGIEKIMAELEAVSMKIEIELPAKPNYVNMTSVVGSGEE